MTTSVVSAALAGGGRSSGATGMMGGRPAKPTDGCAALDGGDFARTGRSAGEAPLIPTDPGEAMVGIEKNSVGLRGMAPSVEGGAGSPVGSACGDGSGSATVSSPAGGAPLGATSDTVPGSSLAGGAPFSDVTPPSSASGAFKPLALGGMTGSSPAGGAPLGKPSDTAPGNSLAGGAPPSEVTPPSSASGALKPLALWGDDGKRWRRSPPLQLIVTSPWIVGSIINICPWSLSRWMRGGGAG